ncbi:aldo/keto reductase [Dokdonella sp.]|uniref:aldo/keto reductase n=1 Tax=Dokdonella sp. TaxID=2291710 RepID=UPI0031BC6F2C|nr:aldo/keto reductase [Dokdonella sp.]
MTTRRDFLRTSLASGAALALAPHWLRAADAAAGPLITRAIPASGERLPIIGLGSSATFAQIARQDDVTALRQVLARMVKLGGTVFDTAPAYGASEEVAGRIARDLGITDRLFWATKLNVASRGGKAEARAARQQLATSLARIGKRPLDLVQVHNMGDLATQLPILREARAAGKIRYLGVTTTFADQYEGLLRAMREEQLDFIGTNYAIDDRDAEKTFLPLARERGIAVLVYAPFGRTRLWKRVAGQKLPDWAAEFDAHSWAQFFLKFVASHPDVTAITPATSKVANLVDNFGAARGRLPDAAMRRRMVELVESLPA